jgi:type IV pilus assembly protein PilW
MMMRTARGFTLIELMVAMVLALLVLGAVAAVYAGTSGTRSEVERAGRLADNAHYTVTVLTEEFQHAGFFAELVPTGVAWQVPDPCATTLATQGWSVTPFQMPVPIAGVAPNGVAPACLANRKAETPIAVMRRVSSAPTPPAQATVGGYLQVSKCRVDPVGFVVSNVPDDFTLHDMDCTTVADVRQLVVRSYFITTCDVCGNDSIPTLKRAEWIGGEIVVTPIAEGIENLQLEYGFDADGDGKPDKYLVAPDAALGAGYGEWANVVAVRMWALVRSPDPQIGYVDRTKQFDLGPAGITQPANDGFRRVMLTSLAIPKNTAGRREAP